MWEHTLCTKDTIRLGFAQIPGGNRPSAHSCHGGCHWLVPQAELQNIVDTLRSPDNQVATQLVAGDAKSLSCTEDILGLTELQFAYRVIIDALDVLLILSYQ